MLSPSHRHLLHFGLLAGCLGPPLSGPASRVHLGHSPNCAFPERHPPQALTWETEGAASCPAEVIPTFAWGPRPSRSLTGFSLYPSFSSALTHHELLRISAQVSLASMLSIRLASAHGGHQPPSPPVCPLHTSSDGSSLAPHFLSARMTSEAALLPSGPVANPRLTGGTDAHGLV